VIQWRVIRVKGDTVKGDTVKGDTDLPVCMSPTCHYWHSALPPCPQDKDTPHHIL
jgi:hypothetical protein